MGELPQAYRRFSEQHRGLWEVYQRLGEEAASAGPIDAKHRELIKLGMAASAGSEGAVQSHTHRALEAGATAAEVNHALLLGVTTLGFPRMMAALTWAEAAISAHRP